MLQKTTLQFIKGLGANNNKPWFEAHRKQYDVAKLDFETFVQGVIDKMGKKDPDIATLKAKETIFRINRDIRFSKDKTPYKDNFGAYINKGGRKSIYGGYYFHCQPGRSFMGGGLWLPQGPEVKKLRQEIDYSWDEFKKLVTSKKFRAVYGDLSRDAESSLSTMPKGYDKENPAAAYLKLRSWITLKPITDAELTSPGLLKKVIDNFETLQPILKFINRSLQSD